MNALLKGQPTGRFLGVNLRQDRVSLADEELAKAINADLHTQPGVIILRMGRTAQNGTALADLAIRRIARINLQRYRVAGQSLYCGETLVLNGLLSPNLITTMMPFRPLNDTTIWNFVADDAVMRKVNCTTVGTWGLPAPSQASVAIGIQGSLSGAYVAQYTFCRLVSGAVVAEGNPSAVSPSVTLSANILAIGDMAHPTDTTTNGLGIYRSTAGTTVTLLDAYEDIPTNNLYAVTHNWEVTAVPEELQLHWTLDAGSIMVSGSPVSARKTYDWEVTGTGNAEDAGGYRGTYRWEIANSYVTTQTLFWAYASTIADTSLGDIVEVDNNPPPLASWVTNFQEHAFLCRDAANPHYLWFSKRFLPEQVPPTNFLEIGNADDPLQCAVPWGGQLGIFARKQKYRVVGNATSGFVSIEAASTRGTPCAMAVIPSEFGILFPARDGIFSTTLTSQDTGFAEKILPLFFGETVNDMLPLNWDQATTFCAAVYKGRYYFSYAETGSTTPNRLAVYSRDTQHWYHYDHPLRSLYVEDDTDLCVGGGLDGYVYILETGNTDNGTNIALDVDTKDFQGEAKDVRKFFLYLKVDLDTRGESVTVKFYVDDVLKRTATVSTSTRAERLVPLPEGTMGHHWRANFTYTGAQRIRIYPCAALYVPMAVV